MGTDFQEQGLKLSGGCKGLRGVRMMRAHTDDLVSHVMRDNSPSVSLVFRSKRLPEEVDELRLVR